MQIADLLSLNDCFQLEFCVECFGAPHDEDCRTSLLSLNDCFQLEFCVECFGAPHDEDCRTSLLAIATTSRTDVSLLNLTSYCSVSEQINTPAFALQ